ncbi:alpha/beta hydrolase [Chitinophaga sp. Cy-1792]|uniref:alpha/beta hydrolase n=1 Tax=Chitinophaga sp. Cy-1792 TaxID=2608339 RepID=UPI00141E91A1|nr:alpha/beta hydrolase [Chitinophaga sp. Cy-1792]NIG54408.1 alpha/beta hydrolase [Chitinophaga sp. Cy-1792]
MAQAVKFKNRTWDMAGNLFLPSNFDQTKKYAAIVCVHPGSSVKEQTAGIYAAKLAAEGFVTLSFDASFQGESGGEPRYIEDPAMRVEDIHAAVDYLTTLHYIDENRIGVLGVCAGGGYAANAAMTERRIKAVGTVAGANIGRLYREGNPIQTLEAIAQQRTAEARGAEPMITSWIPNTPEEAQAAGVKDIDVLQAVDYYRTPRGQYPTACNKLRFISMANIMTFDAFHLAEKLLTQPLQIITGSVAGAFGSAKDGQELFERAASKQKDLYVIEGASHYDLYDGPEYVAQAVDKLVPFYKENL